MDVKLGKKKTILRYERLLEIVVNLRDIGEKMEKCNALEKLWETMRNFTETVGKDSGKLFLGTIFDSGKLRETWEKLRLILGVIFF